MNKYAITMLRPDGTTYLWATTTHSGDRAAALADYLRAAYERNGYWGGDNRYPLNKGTYTFLIALTSGHAAEVSIHTLSAITVKIAPRPTIEILPPDTTKHGGYVPFSCPSMFEGGEGAL